MSELTGKRLVALCDVNQKVIDQELKKFRDKGEQVESYNDVRKLLENKDIDVVTFATPNHWHSLGSIWAVQAGQDVSVEKHRFPNRCGRRQLLYAERPHKRIPSGRNPCPAPHRPFPATCPVSAQR